MDTEVQRNEDGEEVKLPWYMRIQWILYNISLPSSVLVTLIFWGVLYPTNPDMIMSFFNATVHSANLLFMLIEQYVGAIPTRLLHVYQPVAYALCYAVFSIIIFSADGTVLYRFVLDWNNPGITVGVVFGIILFYLVSQLVFYLIYRALTYRMQTRYCSTLCT